MILSSSLQLQTQWLSLDWVCHYWEYMRFAHIANFGLLFIFFENKKYYFLYVIVCIILIFIESLELIRNLFLILIFGQGQYFIRFSPLPMTYPTTISPTVIPNCCFDSTVSATCSPTCPSCPSGINCSTEQTYISWNFILKLIFNCVFLLQYIFQFLIAYGFFKLINKKNYKLPETVISNNIKINQFENDPSDVNFYTYKFKKK